MIRHLDRVAGGVKVRFTILECASCGHEWLPRIRQNALRQASTTTIEGYEGQYVIAPEPKRCPRCQSDKWKGEQPIHTPEVQHVSAAAH